MPSFKDRALGVVRAAVTRVPNSKLLYFMSRTYMLKYNNQISFDPVKNGEQRFLQHMIAGKAQPVVFDVGANKGDWTAAALSVNAAARIHAFEPFPESYQGLVARGFPANVTCVNQGMGAFKGNKTLYAYADHSTHNTLHARYDTAYTDSVEIAINTLESYCDEHSVSYIDFLKIDTEGNDYEVLQGAQSLIDTQRIGAIQFEYGHLYIGARRYLKDFFDLLEPNGYQIYRVMPKHLAPLKAYHHSFENFQYANFAALPRE